MTITETLLLAFALAVDAFTVGAAVGLDHRKPRQVFRLAFHFGLFQALMPLIGALSGRVLRDLIAAFSHWIAFGLLAWVAIRMIREAIRGPDETSRRDLTKGLSLVTLSIAVSIDALAVGFTFGLTGEEFLFPVVVIGIVACLLTLFGMLLAGRIGTRFGRAGGIVAALVLLGIGIRILVEGLSLQ
jgi:putative Mn2+ efflux pump MntP